MNLQLPCSWSSLLIIVPGLGFSKIFLNIGMGNMGQNTCNKMRLLKIKYFSYRVPLFLIFVIGTSLCHFKHSWWMGNVEGIIL